ncbi:unnamed protein product [Heligmosomoides polygyrus]|uniref:Peptidase A2 domain-containing protein n=1 Tax=Heligmosomoides polygyrus TaxID=6339 RepID=A0A183GQ10_HELPZ|nr:unnamed protein product [Heligmosomoides polygyrus]
MAQKTALQVRVSQFTIRDKLSILKELSTTLAELTRVRAPAAAVNDEVPALVERILTQELAVVEEELERLEFVQKQLKEVAFKLNTSLANALAEYSVQAEHDDRCVRELAKLLAVDSTEVGKVTIPRVANEIAIEQLNTRDFENVEYHATFDPIAAAQGMLQASLGKWLCGAVKSTVRKDGLVGERTMRNVNLLGLSKKALLDTGSQISIIPLEMLRAALVAGFDLNADVEEVPIEGEEAVYDASCNRMRFKGAVRLTLQLEGGAKRRIPLFVMAGGDDMIVLDTNALLILGFGITKCNGQVYSQPTPPEERKDSATSRGDMKRREKRKFASESTVTVDKRVYIRPGKTKILTMKCPHGCEEGIFWSDNDLIPDIMCTNLNSTVDITVTNGSSDARIFRAGQKIGRYEPRFDHSDVFERPVNYDLGGHLTTAIAMLDHVRLPGAIAQEQDIFLALPQPFSRVHPDVDYPENVIVFVYQNWSTLAHKMISMPVTTSVIVVWPDILPESREMRQVLIALERHLQCGGALAFFPSPYEGENTKEWTHMGRVCAEFVKYITAPERSFDAIVRDHYSDVLEQAPFTHPACCLGTRPRSGKALFSGRQILVFLKKLRLTVNDLIRLDEFDVASSELKDLRSREKLLRNKRHRDDFRPNFWVIQDPQRRRRELPITFIEPRHPRHR